MTRFARARGSKACNERQEEEATPWCVMRQQLIQAGQVKLPEPPATLETKSKPLKSNNANNIKERWSEFGEPVLKEAITNVAINKKHKTSKTKSKKLDNIVKNNILGFMEEKEHVIDSKSQKSSCDLDSTVCHIRNEMLNKSNKLKKSIKCNIDNELLNKTTRVKKTKASEIHPSKPNETNKESVTGGIASTNNCTELRYATNMTKKPANKPIDRKHNNPRDTTSKELQNPHFSKNLSKNFTSNRYNESHTIISNGREIQIVRYDGFFVKREDAVELKKIKKKLQAQNISPDKIKSVIKLERRKAEKALARDKKAVCFQCRQFGHNFADCPEVMDSDVAKSGMCFKCGSMEHTHFECKISHSQNFRFAVCFVCKDQGHIARQCPANSKGLYPKGGACHFCGDNTHLRMNCPKAVVENQTPSLTLTTDLKGSNLEDISDKNIAQNSKASKGKKKMIKF